MCGYDHLDFAGISREASLELYKEIEDLEVLLNESSLTYRWVNTYEKRIVLNDENDCESFLESIAMMKEHNLWHYFCQSTDFLEKNYDCDTKHLIYETLNIIIKMKNPKYRFIPFKFNRIMRDNQWPTDYVNMHRKYNQLKTRCGNSIEVFEAVQKLSTEEKEAYYNGSDEIIMKVGILTGRVRNMHEYIIIQSKKTEEMMKEMEE